MENLQDILKKRYTAKAYDLSKKVTDAEIEMVKELLQLSASSTNMQPWHFIIAKSDEAKEKVAKSIRESYIFNERKVLDASIVVILCAKVSVDDDYLQHVLAQEEKDGRFPNADAKNMQHAGRSRFSNMHKYEKKDWHHWAEKQVHLNLGMLLLGTAMMGLDSTAIEGFDSKILDEEFGLNAKGFSSSIVVPLGYHSSDDANKTTPKSRLPQSETIEVL